MPVFNIGLDSLTGIASADLRWLMLKDSGYVFNRDDDFVDDLDPASNEITVAGYSRINLTGGTRTVDDTANQITYSADSPDFGTLAGGENATDIVLYEFVTDDSDSTLIAMFSFTSTDTAVFDPFVVTLDGGVVAYNDEV